MKIWGCKTNEKFIWGLKGFESKRHNQVATENVLCREQGKAGLCVRQKPQNETLSYEWRIADWVNRD